jgi:hypothetical protein
MVVFNPSIFENWKSRGYKYIYVLPLKKYGVLQPLTQEKERQKGYSILMHELELIDISGDYFLTKEKDAKRQYAQQVA